MHSVRCSWTVAVLVCAMAILVTAQITFSRDWTGGKRAAPQMSLDCSQFARLCRHFVHELKQTLTSELATKHHHEEFDKSVLYDDE